MREPDFLPSWYAAVRRQRVWLRVQTWSTALLVGAGVCGIVAIRTRAAEAAQGLAVTRARAEAAGRSVRELDETLALKQQLIGKQRVLADVGLPVEAHRVIGELAAAAPREICFDGIELRTEEQPLQRSIADRARDPDAPATTRRLMARVTGAAPTEDAVTTFWTQLMQRPFVDDARVVNTEEKVEDGHTMRAFEITFSIPLDVMREAHR